MGLFSGQLANVVEWEEYRDDVIFYKWNNNEIKKGSRLIIRPGQDAVFLFNGRIEGVFTDEGNYDIESDIVPFLSTLKGFRFGFKTGMKAEVLFVNTKEFNMKWGTKQAVNLPHPSLPGGMPIRANGTFQFKVGDYQVLMEKIAGVKKQYTTEEVRDRVVSMLDQLLLDVPKQRDITVLHKPVGVKGFPGLNDHRRRKTKIVDTLFLFFEAGLVHLDELGIDPGNVLIEMTAVVHRIENASVHGVVVAKNLLYATVLTTLHRILRAWKDAFVTILEHTKADLLIRIEQAVQHFLCRNIHHKVTSKS